MVKIETFWTNKEGQEIALKTPKIHINGKMGVDEEVVVTILGNVKEGSYRYNNQDVATFGCMVDYKGEPYWAVLTMSGAKELKMYDYVNEEFTFKKTEKKIRDKNGKDKTISVIEVKPNNPELIRDIAPEGNRMDTTKQATPPTDTKPIVEKKVDLNDISAFVIKIREVLEGKEISVNEFIGLYYRSKQLDLELIDELQKAYHDSTTKK